MRRFIRRCYRTLIMVVSLAVVMGLAASVTPARAAVSPTGGDFSITLGASDLGIPPSDLQAIVTQVNAEDTRENVSFDSTLKREIAEYGGDTSGWVNTDATLGMTSDGTGLVITVPAADVQTSANWWQSMISAVFAAAIGYGLRGLCIYGLGLTAIGAPFIPLICTPIGGAMTGLFDSVFTHSWPPGDIGSADFWKETFIKVAAGAAGGFLWEKYASPFFKTGLLPLMQRLGLWMMAQASGVESWFGTTAYNVVFGIGELIYDLNTVLPAAVDAYNASPPATGTLPCDIY